MGFEYINDYPCRVKDQYPAEEMLRRLREAAAAEAALARGKAEGLADEELLQRRVHYRNDWFGRMEAANAQLRDLLKRREDLLARAEPCRQCPANAASAPFGCRGVIDYPITRAAEEWIMDHFQGSADEFGCHLQHLIEQDGLAGEAVDRRRRMAGAADTQEQPIFESNQAVEKIYEAEGKRPRSVNSSQVLEFMMGLGQWDGLMIVNFLRDFGAVDPEKARRLDMLESVGNLAGGIGIEGESVEELKKTLTEFRHSPAPGDDPSIIQFKQFLHALLVAYRNGAGVATRA